MAQPTQEMSVEEKLRALYDLQLIHSRLDEIQNTHGELPLEVEDLEDDIMGLETRKGKINEEVKALESDIKQKKEEIKVAESLIKKYTKQQDNVRNNREFEALTKEVEYQELEIQLCEKRIKEMKARIEQKKEAIEELEVKTKQFQEHLEHKKAELDKIVQETEKEAEKLAQLSQEYSQKIEARLLKAYTRIRSAVKNGLAVVPIERGASAGSFFAIPAQRQMEIALRKKIIIDEHSGRILVDEDLAREQREKIEALLHS